MQRSRVHGIGIGFRSEIADALFAAEPALVDFVEIHPENYVRRGGLYPAMLARAQERWPVLTHGLTLSLGSVTRHDPSFVRDVRAFLDGLDAPFHSDHLCFGGVDGVFLHDLLPIPFTDEAVSVAVQRITELRDDLARPIAIENISYYAPQSTDPLDEVAFLTEVAARADAKLLLDVNNVYVNAKNFGFDPREWLARVPMERVVQIHVAGHLVRPDGLRIDTHGESVCDDVFALLGETLRRTGPVPVLLERDGSFPAFDELADELRALRRLYDDAMANRPMEVTP